MELRTIPDVEIVSTGTYSLGTGETTFTEQDLADAVRAVSDPTIVAPRIKLGHSDKRFEGDLDGEPAFGQVANLRLDNNGQTIKGDLVNVPDWLADTLPAHYPGRSIEGGFNFQAPSGNEYKLVISDLALLGTQWPGVTSLADLKAVVSANGTIAGPVAAGAGYDLAGGHAERVVSANLGDPVTASGPGSRTQEERREMAAKGEAMPDGLFPIATMSELESAIRLARTDAQRKHIIKRAKALGGTGKIPDSWTGDTGGEAKAGLNVADFRRVLAADLRAGKVPHVEGAGEQAKWWPRSVEASDDGALSFVIDDEDGHLIELPVTVEGDALAYGPASLRQERIAASGDKGPRVLASWPNSGARPTTGGQKMDVSTDVLIKRLGLPEDADEAAITAALDAPPVAAGAGKSAEKSAVPEGMALIDEATLAELRDGAKAGAEVKASLAKNERDGLIRAAIEAGKFPVGRREHYTKLYDADPEGTRELLASLAEGVVPGAEVGVSGDGDSPEVQAGEDAQLRAFEARFFPEIAQPATAGVNGGGK